MYLMRIDHRSMGEELLTATWATKAKSLLPQKP